MTKQTDGRLRLQLDICLFGWFLYRHKRLNLNGVVSYFVKKGDINVEQKRNVMAHGNARVEK